MSGHFSLLVGCLRLGCIYKIWYFPSTYVALLPCDGARHSLTSLGGKWTPCMSRCERDVQARDAMSQSRSHADARHDKEGKTRKDREDIVSSYHPH